MYGKFGMASAICSMIVASACVAQRPYKHEIHQKYDVFRNIISKALEHLQKAFWNDFAEFASSRV